MEDYIQFIDIDSINEKDRQIAPEEQVVLDEINQKVAGGQSLDDIMNFLFDMDIAPCERLGLAFLEDNADRAVAHWERADYQPLLIKKGFQQDMAGSSLHRVLEIGEPRVINDLERYLADHPKSPSTKLLLREGILSNMTCPLKINNRIIGFLFRSSKEKYAYGYHEVMLHHIVAERISQAVEKAYRIEQLTESNRSYMEMLGFVSHEIKNPLSSIIMDGNILIDGYLGDLSDKQKDRISKLMVKAKFLMELTKDYLDLAKIEGGQLNANIQGDIDILGLIDESISILEAQANNKSVSIDRDFRENPLEIECDPDLMKIVLINLIGNAIKYGKDKAQIKISVYLDEKDVVVSVWNEGPGFSEEEKSKLFRKFSRLKDPELMKRKGSGVGLYSVWRIIQLHHGNISANSKKGQWAEFKFSIPVNQK